MTAPPSPRRGAARIAAAQLELSLGAVSMRLVSREDLVTALRAVASLPARDRLEAFRGGARPRRDRAGRRTPDIKVPIRDLPTLGIIPTVGKGYDGVRVTLAAPATRTLEIRHRPEGLSSSLAAPSCSARRSGFAESYNRRMFDRIAASSPPAPRHRDVAAALAAGTGLCSQEGCPCVSGSASRWPSRRARRGESAVAQDRPAAGMNREQNAPGRGGPKDSASCSRCAAQPAEVRPGNRDGDAPSAARASSCRARARILGLPVDAALIIARARRAGALRRCRDPRRAAAATARAAAASTAATAAG